MKKNILIAISSFAIASSSMGAVTISLSGSPTAGPQFFSLAGAAGSIVPDGSLIRIGTFDATPAAGATFTELASSFHEFARTTMGNVNNTSPNTGRVLRNNIEGDTAPGNPNAANSPDADSFFLNKAIYIWVYNSTTADPAANQGIFLHTLNALTFQDAATATTTSVNGYSTAFGTFTGGTTASTELNANGSGQVVRFNLAGPIIPEPTTAMFGGLLALMGLARRRR